MIKNKIYSNNRKNNNTIAVKIQKKMIKKRSYEIDNRREELMVEEKQNKE